MIEWREKMSIDDGGIIEHAALVRDLRTLREHELGLLLWLGHGLLGLLAYSLAFGRRLAL